MRYRSNFKVVNTKTFMRDRLGKSILDAWLISILAALSYFFVIVGFVIWIVTLFLGRYDNCLFYERDPQKEMSYMAHLSFISNLFGDLGIMFRKKTNAPCGSGANDSFVWFKVTALCIILLFQLLKESLRINALGDMPQHWAPCRDIVLCGRPGVLISSGTYGCTAVLLHVYMMSFHARLAYLTS